ncbi:MAG TPA: D-glycerate dehydrogenase [Gemmatimonadales bacterium]|nr:D-glycerate dehydrogenase [Gemmatimonadales bacterium]
MRNRPVVTVTRRLPDEIEAEIGQSFDARFNRDDRPLPAAQLRQALSDSDAILCTVTDRFTEDVLAAEPLRVRLLANFGVGFNHIDMRLAGRRGIRVTNTPDVLTDDTADLAIALMLMTLRRLGEGERLLRSGVWPGWAPTQHLGRRLTGKALGIVGMGRIGRAVARRAALGFGMRIRYAAPTALLPGEAAVLDAERVDTDELFASSDVVSIHCRASAETRHLVNSRTLGRMAPHAVLINTARGDIVDEAALAAALEAGHLAAAGLDVYEEEPRVHPGLLHLENVVLLPHLGSATIETRLAMGRRALANLAAFFEGQPLPDEVSSEA